ncbi:ribonuclease H-like domain-containing protein [Tanacetum coccineum]
MDLNKHLVLGFSVLQVMTHGLGFIIVDVILLCSSIDKVLKSHIYLFMWMTLLIILTASSLVLLKQIIDSLHNEFDMTDLEALNYFLGISTTRISTGLSLSQKKYALQLLERAHMVNCNPSLTPVDTESKLVQQICLYMHDPREPYFAALKRCPSTRKSTSGYCVFLGDNLLSWSAKLHHTLSRSSVEAKYRGVAYVVAKTDWLRNLLRELHSPLSTATLVYCDNVSAIYMSANPVQHQQTKHIELDIYFFRDMVTAGQVRVLHVPSRYQYADIFTKGLPSALFEDFLSSLSVCTSVSLRFQRFVDICKSSSEASRILSIVATICWFIWRSRYAFVYDNANLSLEHTLTSINAQLNEFVKINCDAAFKDSKAALTIVARDSTSSLIYVDDMPYSSMSPLHAEVLAVHYACQLAFHRGWFQAIVESDCQTAITFLSTETIPPWNLAALVSNIRS